MTPLTHLLATSATGYGAIIDWVLNIRTITDSPNGVAINALHVRGFQILSTCTDRDCDCMVATLNRLCPDVKIAPVSVAVTNQKAKT